MEVLILGSQTCLCWLCPLQNCKHLKLFRKVDFDLKSSKAGIDSIRPRLPHCCNSPKNELMKLPKLLAWCYGKALLIKLLHMPQHLEMVEQPATFLIPFSIVHSVFHQYAVCRIYLSSMAREDILRPDVVVKKSTTAKNICDIHVL